MDTIGQQVVLQNHVFIVKLGQVGLVLVRDETIGYIGSQGMSPGIDIFHVEIEVTVDNFNAVETLPHVQVSHSVVF